MRFLRIICLPITVAFLAPVLRAQNPPAQPPEENDIEQKRSEWFYGQRAYPHRFVPAGARFKAFRDFQALATLQLPAVSAQWTFLGPQPTSTPFVTTTVSGRVSAIAVDPRSNNTVYLGGAQGGVWKTTDGGTTWTELTDSQASLAIGSIVLDPTNPNIVYVGTGEENFSGDSYYGAGILKSTDAGATWTNYPGPFVGPFSGDGFYGGGARIGSLAVHPTNNQILLAGVALVFKDGIYRSTDGGVNWTQVLAGNSGNSVIFDPTNGNIAFASMGNNFNNSTDGVYKSTDAGVTWQPANGTGANVLPSSDVGRVVLTMAPSNHLLLFAGIASAATGNLLGFFKTTDGGANWTRLTTTTDYCTPQCGYDNAIAVQPTNSNVIYAGGAFGTTLIRSMDGGTTWTTLAQAAVGGIVHADVHALVFTPDGTELYVGNDGGALSTINPTATTPTFVGLNAQLGITQFYPGLAIHPTNPAIALGGTQDNGTQLYGGSLQWNEVTCGDGGFSVIDQVTPSNMYTTCQEIAIFKSTSSGTFGSWNSAQNGINTGDFGQFIPPMVGDPSNPLTLYFGTTHVYQTTDGASTWAPISPSLNTGGFNGLTSITVAPGNSNTVYVSAGDSHLHVTNNALSGAGATWTDITNGLPLRFPTQVAVDPTNPSIAYVTFSGFTAFGDSLGHVFKTTNGGTNWNDISGNLPNIPVNAIVIDPSLASTYYIGTDFGVMYTTNGGTSWAIAGTGLPRVAILGLTFHQPSRTLRAASHGRGIWDINVNTLIGIPALTSLSPSSAIAGSASFTLTVNGSAFSTNSVVQWNGTNLSTTYVSAAQLTASVPTADIAVAGTASIDVSTPGAPASNTLPFTINNPVPATTRLSPASAIVGGSGFTLTVSGSNFVNGSTVLWNGSNRSTTFVSSTKVRAAIPASDIAATGTAAVTVSNPAPGGGTSSPPLTFSINNPVPVLSSLSPSSVTAGGSNFTLTVNGSSFVNGSAILWNGAAFSTAFVSAAQLTATVPAADIGAPGTASITVSNPAPGGGTSSALTFTISNPVPGVTRISPNSATAGGPAFTLTVTGNHFETNSVVLWNGSARSTTYVSGTSLTAAITAADIATPGTASVSVMTPAPGGGTSGTLSFTIKNPVPGVTSLSPSSAVAGSGAFILTVNGSNFVQGAVVQWNGSNRTTTFVNAAQVTASVAAADIAAAGTATVKVKNPAPGGGASTSLKFTINNPVPVASALSPSSVVAGSATFTLTVTGSGFVSGSTVHWKASILTTTFVNSGKLTASVPSSDVTTAGTASITVVNGGPGGGTSNALTFTVNNPVPKLTSLSPSSTTAGGSSFTLTVNGASFVSGASILWNGTSLRSTFVSATQLTATVSAADIAAGGTASVSVSNPSPGGGTSGSLPFTINNPVPTITLLSPASATHGGAAFTLTVNGTGFQDNSKVLWNGSPRTTTYVRASQVTAAITAADIANAGTASVTSTTPAPGGGTSAPATFTIK